MSTGPGGPPAARGKGLARCLSCFSHPGQLNLGEQNFQNGLLPNLRGLLLPARPIRNYSEQHLPEDTAQIKY